jgi:hypothetical protein
MHDARENEVSRPDRASQTWSGAAVAILATAIAFAFAPAAAAIDTHAIMATPIAVQAGARTRGGAQPFGSIYRVTNLNDDGPGSLRHAIGRGNPRVIVFDIAGTIKLKSDLHVLYPWITIAGQTAPPPGITLTRGTLRIRTSDVIVQHIAIRPGPADTPENNSKRDAITIAPCSRCGIPTHGVLIDNVSASWSVDENIGIFGAHIRQVTVRNSIIAEALRNAGHPKGAHTAGLLVGSDMEGLEIVGNIFANNGYRNPAVNTGTSLVIANNLIYNPHNHAIHINAVPKEREWRTRASVIANVMVPGPDTRQDVPTLLVSRRMLDVAPDTIVYARGNLLLAPNRQALKKPEAFKLRSKPSLIPRNWDLMTPELVWRSTAQFAGTRPRERDSVDRRILDGIKSREGRIIDQPIGMDELENRRPVEIASQVPSNAFAPSSIDDLLRVEAWLCARHLEVGGARTPQCHRSLIAYHDALLNAKPVPERTKTTTQK